MPFDPSVTFEKAEQARNQRLSIARGRRAPDPLGVIEEASRRHTYHVFNVGPWPQKINTGSTGWRVVPPGIHSPYLPYKVPHEQEFSEMILKVPGIVSELTIKDEFEYNRLMSDGWKFAQEICGIGRNRPPKLALTNYGLFPSKNAVPTAEEKYEAMVLLHATCQEIVTEARNHFAMDRKQFTVVVRPARHFVAAGVLNLEDEPWMLSQTPSQRVKCKYCGSMNDEIAVLCQKCNHIINAERFRELKEEEEAILGPQDDTDPPKRGPGRPRKEE